MSDLRELYQDTILHHSRQPRNFGKLEHTTHRAEGHNPLCGDRLVVYLDVEDGRVNDIRFEGAGCAISTASASLMTEALKGKTVDEAIALFHELHERLTGQKADDEGADHPHVDLGKLAVFEGVRQYPLRVKCATLAWHTVKSALEGKADEVVVTE